MSSWPWFRRRRPQPVDLRGLHTVTQQLKILTQQFQTLTEKEQKP